MFGHNKHMTENCKGKGNTAEMSQKKLRFECALAFKQRNKQDAKRLLPLIEQPADIRIATYVPGVGYAELVSLLHLAATTGWIDIIIELITKYKCDTNCKDNNGHTPLHYAASNIHLEVVRYFINEQHCDPMTRDNNGDTPLHCACYNSQIDIVRYLLSTGKVNPLAKNKDGEPPMHIHVIDHRRRLPMLHLAAHQGWMDIAIDLITKYKCDTNCKDSHGRTPLHYAVINNHLEVVRYFINEQHCDPMTKDNNGNTPLHYACRHRDIDIVRYLLSTGKVNPLARNKDGEPPMHIIDHRRRLPMLHLAAHQGWMDIAIDLITKYRSDINIKDSNGRTPLHYAASSNHLEVVQYLIIEQHCDPMTKDNDGNTLLHCACYNSHIDIVRYLLSTGKVNPLARNKNGKSPIFILDHRRRLPMLHLAAHQGWTDVFIDLITKYKSDTANYRDAHGQTPLYYAISNKHMEIVRYIINTQHYHPMTKDNVQYLLSTGQVAKNYNEEMPHVRLPLLHMAAAHSWLDIIDDLISKYKFNINSKDSHGRTPLYHAVIKNHLELVRYFINDQHCDPMTRDNNGNTPLHIACRYGNANVVQYLLSTGKVDPLAENNDGKAPMFKLDHRRRLPMLHLAAHHGWTDIFIALLNKYKCDATYRDTHGRTPLHYAASNNHLEVVRYLIIEQHCDPMTRDDDGDTPLHYACYNSHIDIVRYLLSTGKVNPLARNKDGKPPMFIIDYRRLPMLHLAAHQGWTDIFIYLLNKYMCDTAIYWDSHGHTPLYYAICNKHMEIVRHIINKQHYHPMTKYNVQYLLSTGQMLKNNNEEMPQEYVRLPLLHMAAAHGWLDIIIELISKYKCGINSKDSCGHTPLYYAVINNHLEVVRYLIDEQHCDPMTRDIAGNTPLHYACHNSHIDIVQYLLSTGKVNPLARNEKGNHPLLIIDFRTRLPMLHLAAQQGWMDIAIDLITKYKCDINRKESNGRTPLYYAVINNHLEVIRYLIIEQHCDPMTRDDDGDTPLHIACQHSHIDIVQYLLSTGKVNPLARNEDDKAPMLKLDCRRLPMLHLAAHQGWMDIAIYLITKYKCDINRKESNGRTPLYYAASNNHLEMVRYFINEQHCDPMTRDNDGDTPLHIACRYGNANVVQYLLSTGKVDLLAENNNKETPVDIATQINSYDLLKLFQSFPQCEKDFPVHTYTKLILTGYSGAGKTTISQMILLLATKTGFFSRFSSGRVPDVECLTAGIIPLHVESKVNEVGNMVIYDFAGQQEYYSSHDAVLERIMRNSAAIFVCVIDLRQCMDKISESIDYWISFIENACSSAQGSSHIIIVGSHADLVKPSQELTRYTYSMNLPRAVMRPIGILPIINSSTPALSLPCQSPGSC